MTPKEILLTLAYKYQGDWDQMTRAMREKVHLSKGEIEKATKSLEGTHSLTILDPEYPESLKQCAKPPLVLFYEGNLSLIFDSKRAVSYVGARKASEYGLRKAKEIAEGLAKEGISVVSGLARGIDGAAGEAAAPFGKAVAVLGNGLDVYYPAEHSDLQRKIARDGLLLSEYPPGVEPAVEHFPMRNRIIAALSCVTVVGECSPHSGTMITVCSALGMGRDVACLPFEASPEAGTNLLIQEGAPLIQNARDVLDLMGVPRPKLENGGRKNNFSPLYK